MVKRETPAQVFSCNFCRTLFYRTPLGFASIAIVFQIFRSTKSSQNYELSCSAVQNQIGVLKKFPIFTGNQLYWSLFLIKLHAY